MIQKSLVCPTTEELKLIYVCVNIKEKNVYWLITFHKSIFCVRRVSYLNFSLVLCIICIYFHLAQTQEHIHFVYNEILPSFGTKKELQVWISEDTNKCKSKMSWLFTLTTRVLNIINYITRTFSISSQINQQQPLHFYKIFNDVICPRTLLSHTSLLNFKHVVTHLVTQVTVCCFPTDITRCVHGVPIVKGQL